MNGAYLKGTKFDGNLAGSKPNDDEAGSAISEKTEGKDTAQVKPPPPVSEDKKRDVAAPETAGDQGEGLAVAPPAETDEPVQPLLVSGNLQSSTAPGGGMDKKKGPAQGPEKGLKSEVSGQVSDGPSSAGGSGQVQTFVEMDLNREPQPDKERAMKAAASCSTMARAAGSSLSRWARLRWQAACRSSIE